MFWNKEKEKKSAFTIIQMSGVGLSRYQNFSIRYQYQWNPRFSVPISVPKQNQKNMLIKNTFLLIKLNQMPFFYAYLNYFKFFHN